MTLSLTKLENFIGERGMLIKKIFTLNKEAVYIEIFNLHDAESFIVYIPSKYNIKVENRKDAFKLKYLEINEKEDFMKKESERQEQYKNYEEIDLSPDKNSSEDLENTLKNNYNKPVLLANLNMEDRDNIKDIFYQLSRFKLCVETIKYKISILYKNYLCCIKRDNSIECYTIKHFPKVEERKLFIVIDLENLYLKINNISKDTRTVKNGIYKVLNQNQFKHTKILTNILDQKNTLSIYTENINIKNKQINDNLNNLEELLKKLNDNEKENIGKIIEINNKYQDSTSKGLNSDIQRTHEISVYEKKIDTINNVREEIIRDIIVLKAKQENMILTIDKILFDNSIMLNTITNNFYNLSKII
jgi:hypothetical protein